MSARVGLSAVAGLAAVAAMMSLSAPAHAVPGWLINTNTGQPLNLPDTTRPSDEFSKYGPFAEYMYGSVIITPLGRVNTTLAPTTFIAPSVPYAVPPAR